MNVQGVILAGGQSSRMGTNKALLHLHTKKVIEHIIEQMQMVTEHIIIIANEPTLYEHYGYPVYKDRYENKGPLAGLETALYHMEGDIAVISPCDTPFIHHTIYNQLLKAINQHDAVVPQYANRMHPLAGIYRKSIYPYIKENIENDELRMTSFFKDIDLLIQNDFSTLDPEIVKKHFFNMNTVEDFTQAKEL